MRKSKLEARRLAKVGIWLPVSIKLAKLRTKQRTLPFLEGALLTWSIIHLQTRYDLIRSIPAKVFRPDGRIDKRRERRFVYKHKRPVIIQRMLKKNP